MRLVFCGTPRFAVPTLEALAEAGFSIPLVVTQPDRPRGRGMEIAQSPVKAAALNRGIPVAQPEQIKDNPELRKQLEQLSPEAIIVVGYGRIIPKWMRDLPPHGNINLHASLLPKYRGAAPIQWAIASGEQGTGNTTMRIDAGLDTGDILLQEETPIRPEDDAVTLGERLAAGGATLMVRTLRELAAGRLIARPQDDATASLAPVLKKEDGKIDFSRPAQQIQDRLRGFQPWPGAFCTFRNKQLKLVAAKTSGAASSLAPGELQWQGERLLLGCGGNTALELITLQPEGKAKMSALEFMSYQIKTGERLA